MHRPIRPNLRWLALGPCLALAGCSTSGECSSDAAQPLCTPSLGDTDEASAYPDEPVEPADRESEVARGSVERPAGAGPVTYHRDVRPLLESNCVECHRAGGIGPLPFESFDVVRQAGPLIVASVQDDRMPPWPASDTCHPIADSRALSPAEKGLFAAWRDDGYPEGEPSEYVAPRPPARLSLGEPSLLLKPHEGFTPEAHADTYHCFLLGSVDEDTYLTALDIIPDNVAEVHHAQLHRVDADQVGEVRALDDADPAPGYACGSSGVGSNAIASQNMFSYRPGSLTVVFNQGDAAFLEKGSGLVLQMHYNTQFLPPGESPTPDATGIAMWTLPPSEPPDHVIYRTGVLSPLSGQGDGSFFDVVGSSIPAGERDVIGESLLPMRHISQLGSGLLAFASDAGRYIPGQIIGMTPHAHAWARRMQAELRPGADAEACLVDIPRWDYGWQLDYMFEAGVPYGPDDMLHVSCLYDNSAENQPVIDGERRLPEAVRFGENTLDEMCLHYLWLRFRYADFQAARAEQALERRAGPAERGPAR